MVVHREYIVKSMYKSEPTKELIKALEENIMLIFKMKKVIFIMNITKLLISKRVKIRVFLRDLGFILI